MQTPSPTPVNTVLRTAGHTFEQVLDISNLIGELHTNHRLQKYLCEEPNIRNMIDFVCGLGEKEYQLTSTRVICNDVSVITQNIMYYNDLISFLLNQFNQELDQITLDCVSQVLTVLLKPESTTVIGEVVDLFDIAEGLSRHFDNYEVVTFLISLLKRENDNNQLQCTQWLCQQGLVTLILQEFINESDDNSTNESAIEGISHIFVDYFNTSERLNDFIVSVFKSKNDFLLEHGLSIIQNVLACCASSSESCALPSDGLPFLFRCLNKYYDALVNLLDVTQNHNKPIQIQATLVLFSLVISNYTSIYDQIIHYNFLESLLDNFFSYGHSCTILRQIIFDLFKCIFQRPIQPLLMHLLENGILNKFIDEDFKSMIYLKQNRYLPDHHLLNVLLMKTIFELSSTPETECSQLILNNENFQNYMIDVVLPREDIKSTYFEKEPKSDSEINDFKDVDSLEDSDDFLVTNSFC
ncbi:Uncharacterized protein QTN25_007195 [Entamoeba marina]